MSSNQNSRTHNSNRHPGLERERGRAPGRIIDDFDREDSGHCYQFGGPTAARHTTRSGPRRMTQHSQASSAIGQMGAGARVHPGHRLEIYAVIPTRIQHQQAGSQRLGQQGSGSQTQSSQQGSAESLPSRSSSQEDQSIDAGSSQNGQRREPLASQPDAQSSGSQGSPKQRQQAGARQMEQGYQADPLQGASRTDWGASAEARSATDEASDTLSDAWITTKVKAAFVADPEIDALDISVSTDDGCVCLDGSAATLAEIQKARAIAESTEGVRSVECKIVQESAL